MNPENQTLDINEIRSWANQLASENRVSNWTRYWYIWPDTIRRIKSQLETMNGGVICLVGPQGVGKSSALQAIYMDTLYAENQAYIKARNEGKTKLSYPEFSIMLFKWRRTSELFEALTSGTHEVSRDFTYEYKNALDEELKRRNVLANKLGDIETAEKLLDKNNVDKIRKHTWLNMLRTKRNILIDTPDYSKTDKRMMVRDLSEIYWIWNWLNQTGDTKPNLVIAVQKDMSQGHFFFDKMQKIELKPLQPKEMLEAYRKRFDTFEPFTEDALLMLGKLSRGIFRRFLKYIISTLETWETQSNPRGLIETDTVREAIPSERLTEDMALELLELFPRHSDFRIQAVRLLTHLSETGSRTQSKLVEELGLEPYEVSRLLSKLELYGYVSRERSGTDKIVIPK